MFKPFFHPLRHSLLNDGVAAGGVQEALLYRLLSGGAFAADETFHDYTIPEVDLDFAVIYELSFSSNWNNARALTQKTFLNSTTVRATAGGSVTTFSLVPRFFVIEFDHLLINSMQNITPTFAASSNLQLETIGSVNLVKTQLVPAGFYVENNTYDVRAHNVRFSFDDPTTLRMTRDSAGASDALYMSIFILEF